MNKVSDIFNLDELKDCLFNSAKEAIDKFCSTDENEDVYALVFDCDESVGQITLRYANIKNFNNRLAKYGDSYYSHEILGLRGFKYSCGDFEFMDFKEEGVLKRFTDMYYYVMTDEYYGEEELPDIKMSDEVRKDYIMFFEELILDCIYRLDKDIDKLHKTEDFIFFLTYHDMDYEEEEKLIEKTVDKELFEKLLNDSYK